MYGACPQPLDEKRALASAPHEKQCERNGR